MPYGCLDPEHLSAASLKALTAALEWWQKSMAIPRQKTVLLLAGYEQDYGLELSLRKEMILRSHSEGDLVNNFVEIRAKNEEDLAHKITRARALLPIETLVIFAESRHALSLRPIFRRKFASAVEIKRFKTDFEFNHPWISTSSSITWFLWNLLLRIWLEFRKRAGRNLRKRLRSLFWS